MGYDNSSLYNAKEFSELESDFINKYNVKFETSLTSQDFRYTNVYSIFLLIIQYQLQNENNIGLLYDKLISYLKTKQSLEVSPKGATYVGLENALKSIKQTNSNNNLIQAINLADHNLYPSICAVGEAIIALEYENNFTNNRLIAQCLAENAPIGPLYRGSIIGDAASPTTGNVYAFHWDLINTCSLKVNLHYKYNRNYLGKLISEEDIKSSYVHQFNTYYKSGNDILPAQLNDLTNFQSLAYVNTEFSIDGGSNYLPINKVLEGSYNIKFVINSKDTDILLIKDD